MLLVDIGNTRLNFSLLKGEKVRCSGCLELKAKVKKKIGELLSRYRAEDILLCSVVPSLTAIFKKIKKRDKKMGGRIYIAGKDLKIPLRSFYNKKKAGADRLVAAYAAKNIFPSARLIIDFGSAITFDFLSPQGDYLGGLILPGVASSLRALSSCALLPQKIKLKRIRCLVPRDTEDSISKGVVEGFSAMVNALVKKYRKAFSFSSRELPVITGGDAVFFLSRLEFPYIYEPDLVLKGLIILSKKLPAEA